MGIGVLGADTGRPIPVAGRGLLQCRAYRYQVSVTAETVMHRTRVSLRVPSQPDR